jgi:hypothetical protein
MIEIAMTPPPEFGFVLDVRSPLLSVRSCTCTLLFCVVFRFQPVARDGGRSMKGLLRACEALSPLPPLHVDRGSRLMCRVVVTQDARCYSTCTVQ